MGAGDVVGAAVSSASRFQPTRRLGVVSPSRLRRPRVHASHPAAQRCCCSRGGCWVAFFLYRAGGDVLRQPGGRLGCRASVRPCVRVPWLAPASAMAMPAQRSEWGGMPRLHMGPVYNLYKL